jgi:hypothetical protein
MKIDTHDLPDVTQQCKTLQQPQSPVGRFDAFLEKAMSPQSGQPSPLGVLPPLQGLSPASVTVPAGIDRGQTVKRIDGFLTVMESYQKKMADPNASLKDAYPFVRQMENTAAELLPAMESLPAGDKLKEILNHLLVTSTVEVTKFNRGDYI